MSPKVQFLQILRLPDVEIRTGLKRSRLYELEASKRFPTRVKLSERAVGWYAHEVDAWLSGRVRARREAA